jgi:hypothetical protein
MTRRVRMVVGIFPTEAEAFRAMQMLASRGFDANILSTQGLRALRDDGTNESELRLYESRFWEGNTLLSVNAGNGGQQALEIMLQAGAENIQLGGRRNADYYYTLDPSSRHYGL